MAFNCLESAEKWYKVHEKKFFFNSIRGNNNNNEQEEAKSSVHKQNKTFQHQRLASLYAFQYFLIMSV